MYIHIYIYITLLFVFADILSVCFPLTQKRTSPNIFQRHWQINNVGLIKGKLTFLYNLTEVLSRINNRVRVDRNGSSTEFFYFTVPNILRRTRGNICPLFYHLQYKTFKSWTALFWAVTQRVVAIPYRCFGTDRSLDPWIWDCQAVPKRRWGISNTRCLIASKVSFLTCFMVEAWNLAIFNHVIVRL